MLSSSRVFVPGDLKIGKHVGETKDFVLDVEAIDLTISQELE